MAGPRAGARESAARGIDRAALDAKCDTITEEDAVADGAMHRIIGEAVAGVVAKRQPRVTAKDIEEIAVAAHVEDQAAAAECKARIGAAGLGGGLLVAKVELDANSGAEEVSQPATTTDLVIEVECSIVAREGGERADFELMGMLGESEGWNDSETEHQQNHPSAHVSPEG